MRKIGYLFVFLLGMMGLAATPTMAATPAATDAPICKGIELTAPADGAVLSRTYQTNFKWNAEPRGTASRDWVSIAINAKHGKVTLGTPTNRKADRGHFRLHANGHPGVYNWFVLFYNANGKVICMSEQRTYVIGDGNSLVSAIGNHFGTYKIPAIVLGRYIIVLTGNGSEGKYGGTGTVNRYFAGNDYKDGSDHDGWQAAGYTGLEIWGNDNNNDIAGSDLSDEIHGGNETCSAGTFSSCGAGDTIHGGDGDDVIYGGDETCSAASLAACGAGDIINGDKGDDTIYGGDESCSAKFLGVCAGGDAIDGGEGSDTIDGQGGTDAITGGIGDGTPDSLTGGPDLDVIAGEPGDTVNP